MDGYDYKEIMRQFYAHPADFISNMPEVLEEIANEERFFKNLNMSEVERRNLVFDWYIFDYKSEALSKNLLQYFLEKADIGDPESSEDDLELNRRLVEAGKILGIEVIDHIVVSKSGYFSFKEQKLL